MYEVFFDEVQNITTLLHKLVAIFVLVVLV